jgi:hypothetical protein
MRDENPTENGSIRMRWKKLNTEQKIAIIALVIGASFIFVISALRVRHGVYAPFLVSISEYQEKRDLIKDPIAEREALLKRIDTDGDGLSDWSEINVYKTSPYLWSTAGDNIPDNVKIARGENPLCKSGEECTIGALNINLPTTTLPFDVAVNQDPAGLLNDVLMGTAPGSNSYQNMAVDAGIDLETMKSQIPKDPAVLRDAILQTGKVTKEDLDNISDEDLLKLINEAMAELESEIKTEQQNQEINL